MASVLRPIELVVLQGTPFCNLNCGYCDLSPASRRERRVMPPELIDKAFQDIFSSARCADQITIIWHSGEPLTLDTEYYEDAIERILDCRAHHATRPIQVRFDIQTNGVRIDRAWQDFFKRHRHHLSVGLSCDGPATMHDRYRVNWAGRSSHAWTVQGMRLLSEAGIRFKVIAVVTDLTLEDPDGFFEFFWSWRDAISGFHFNILASGNEAPDPSLRYSYDDRQRYLSFYKRLIDLARERRAADNGFTIQNFSQALSRILSPRAPGGALFCEETSAPLKSISIDTLGNVTTFYAGLSAETFADQYGDGAGLSLGNIWKQPLESLVGSPKLQRMISDFAASNAACAAVCPYHTACSGGFELTKLSRYGRFDIDETPECVIHVKTLIDALLDDLAGQRLDTAERESRAPAFEGASGEGGLR